MEGPSIKVRGVSSICEAGEQDLAFCAWEGEKGVLAVSRFRAGIMLCKKRIRGLVTSYSNSQLVFLDNPRLAFVQSVNKVRNHSGVSTDASRTLVSESKIGKNCHIGSLAIIRENCVIGDNVVIEDRASLKNCRVGDGCVIQSGVAIGSDSFAYERHPDGDLERFPNLDSVVIEKSVAICANSSIAGGSPGDTTIGNDIKIDALVHVAHNAQVGSNCQLAAGTIIEESTTVGNSCWTGLNPTLKNQIHVGNAVLVAAGACVIHDLFEEIVAGVPTKSKNKVTSNELFIMTGKKSHAS